MRALTAALVTALLIIVAGALPVAADDDGLRFEASTTYELQPEGERVRVSMDVSLTNLLRDRGNQFFYFDQIGVPVLAEATNVAAQRVGGGALSASVRPTDDPEWSTLIVGLSPVLRYQQPQRLRLTYDLPNLAPRSTGWTRATEAYASFLVHAVGDPGRTDVTVVVPTDYSDLHAGGAPMSRSRSDGNWVYSAAGIAEPEEWWAILAARNDELLAEREAAVAGHPAVLRYWPGDDEWADFAEEMVTTGVPVLEQLIGRPWPVEGQLQITESSAPHAYGYGGWYDTASNQIEVSDELEPALMLHELAHAWFNHHLTPEAWFLEGLAELYAHRALAELEGSAPSPEPLPDGHPGAQPLLSWVQVPFESTEADEYAYGTAWWLLDQIYDEIGAASMAAVITAVAEREISYRSDREPEEVSGQVDWRRILDLLVEVGGSDAVPDLFREHVITPDDEVLLDERDAARSSYAEFIAGSGGWNAPLEVREAMTRWRFDEVDDLTAVAARVLEHRDHVLAVIGEFGVAELPALEETYQSEAMVSDLVAESEEYVEISAVIAEARDAGTGAAGLLAEIGLLGTDVQGGLGAAATALAAGDLDAARSASGDVLDDVQQAPAIGAVLVGQVVVAAGLFWPLRGLRKRRLRTEASAVGSDPWQTDEPFSSLSNR